MTQPDQNHEQLPNPLLDRVRMPGETFTLPSGGLFYTNGELSSEITSAEVHIYPMTALDEIIIKTPDKLFSGDAVKEIFGRCVPGVLKPTELLAKDVDYILMCLRKVTFGETMDLEYTHTCKDAEEHTYNVEITHLIQGSKKIDPTTMDKKYQLKLENDQIVKFQPIRFIDYVQLMQINEDEKLTPERLKEVMFTSISNVVTAVDEVTDKKMILQWLDKLTARWIRDISTKIGETAEWGPTFETGIVCKDCDKPVTITTPLNPIAFFT